MEIIYEKIELALVGEKDKGYFFDVFVELRKGRNNVRRSSNLWIFVDYFI